LVIGSHQSVGNEVDPEGGSRRGFAVTRRMSGGGTMLCEPNRTITYALYLPESLVVGISFRKSYAELDAWAVQAFNELGVPASYREINDIISPRGKIAGAAQARRRGFVLHHTTIAHTMDVDLLAKVIRIGRPGVVERGVRSAAKEVSPLSWFTPLPCDEVAASAVRTSACSAAIRSSDCRRSETSRPRRAASLTSASSPGGSCGPTDANPPATMASSIRP